MRLGYVIGRKGFFFHIQDDHQIVAVGPVRIGSSDRQVMDPGDFQCFLKNFANGSGQRTDIRPFREFYYNMNTRALNRSFPVLL